MALLPQSQTPKRLTTRRIPQSTKWHFHEHCCATEAASDEGGGTCQLQDISIDQLRQGVLHTSPQHGTHEWIRDKHKVCLPPCIGLENHSCCVFFFFALAWTVVAGLISLLIGSGSFVIMQITTVVRLLAFVHTVVAIYSSFHSGPSRAAVLLPAKAKIMSLCAKALFVCVCVHSCVSLSKLLQNICLDSKHILFAAQKLTRVYPKHISTWKGCWKTNSPGGSWKHQSPTSRSLQPSELACMLLPESSPTIRISLRVAARILSNHQN